MSDNNKVYRAVIYVRVSTDKQRLNYSPPTMLAASLQYAQDKGYSLVGDAWVDPETALDVPRGTPDAVMGYVDDEKGWKISRPMWDRVIDFADRVGFDILVVHHIDRFVRGGLITFALLENEMTSRGIRVEYVLGQYANDEIGEFHKGLDVLVSQMENVRRAERVVRGKLGKAKRGLWPAGPAPYGYVTDKQAPGGLRIVADKSEIVRLIFRLYVEEKQSLGQIKKYLEGKGIPSPRGSEKWHRTALRRILCQAAYMGHGLYNRRIKRREQLVGWREKDSWIEIEVTPLIDEETFARAQIQLDINRETKRRPGRIYLLTGFIRCVACDRVYYGTTRTALRPTSDSYVMYCHNKLMGHCRNHSFSGRPLERAVWSAIKQLILKPEKLREGFATALEEHQKKFARHIERLQSLDMAEAKMRAQLDRLWEIYADPDTGMSKIAFLERRKRLEAELEEAAAQRSLIETELGTARLPSDLSEFEEFIRPIREFLEGGEEPSTEEKRVILEGLHVQVLIYSDNRIELDGWTGEPVDLTAFLLPPAECWSFLRWQT